MANIIAFAQFVASKAGKNSITVTWDVERITRSDGTRSALVTGGATNVTVGRRGLYGYLLADADLTLYDYVFTAITADSTVDQQEIAAMWTLWSLSWHDIGTTLMTVAGSFGKRILDLVDGMTSLPNWLRGLARKDAMDATAKTEINSGGGGYNESTDSLEAQHDGYVAPLDAAATAAAVLDATAASYNDPDTIGEKINDASTAADLPDATTIAAAVLDAEADEHDDPDTIGEKINNAGNAADPLLNEVPGSYASGTAGAALGRIGRGTISTTAPTAQNGDVTTYQGAVYLAARGTALEWTDREAAWPDLTDAVIVIYIEGGPELTGEVVTATGAGKKVRQELTAADSEAIPIGNPRFQVWAEWEEDDPDPEFYFPLVEGKWNSKAKCTPAPVED